MNALNKTCNINIPYYFNAILTGDQGAIFDVYYCIHVVNIDCKVKNFKPDNKVFNQKIQSKFNAFFNHLNAIFHLLLLRPLDRSYCRAGADCRAYFCMYKQICVQG